VPDISLDSGYREAPTHPDGLTYIENYVSEDYAKRIEQVLAKSRQSERSENCEDALIHLKKRQVKHYGYEFRYGTNDCDVTKPLTDPDSQMPEVLQELFEKMLHDELITVVPDQMTVNFYEPGQGIPPHTDNTNAFGEYIISLSLKSSVQMELRENGTKRFSRLYLRPNSLLVLKGDSRYNWAHMIAERKHDLVIDGKHMPVVKRRERRISLTFRKLRSDEAAPVKSKNVEVELPVNGAEAVAFERAHVHEVYNGIADHFSSTRHSAWPGVAKFIREMEPYSLMVDAGCGNGKYLNLRKDLVAVVLLEA
jgi:alkylated DNA repair protein alkB family protein 8